MDVFFLHAGIWLFLILSLASPVEAHRPIGIGLVLNSPSLASARIVENPEVSQVLYAELREPGRVDTLAFTGRKGEKIFLQLGVPQIARFQGFRPCVALIGPGLSPAPSDLPFPLPPGYGAEVLRFLPGWDDVFFEPFTRTSSWRSPSLRLPLPASGKYDLLVYDPQGKTGKYWLAIGEKEEFGPGDWLQLPQTVWKVRRFHELDPVKDALAVALSTGIVALILWRLKSSS